VSVPTLTPDESSALLEVAARSIHDVLARGTCMPPDESEHDGALREKGATFVTLERDEQLLGCIGSLEATRPLVVDVAANAVAAALYDPRLPPVSVDDYPLMAIEISVLSRIEPLPVESYDELARALAPGRDGLVVEVGPHRATFLPAVWRHFGDDVEGFLGALWSKAGLVPAAWDPHTRCGRYTATKLVDPGPRAPVARH